MARETTEVPEARSDAVRRRHAALALSLAEESGDEKLQTLLEIATITDANTWIKGGSKLLSERERAESRAEHWRRVWAHLAGKDVVVMGSRGRRPGEGHAWATAKLITAPGQSEAEARIVLSWDVEAGLSGVRVLRQQRRASRALYLAEARRLAGGAWSEVAWGDLGSRTPRWTHRVRLPRDKQNAALLAKGEAQAVVRRAREHLAHYVRERDAGTRRMRLDSQLRQVVTYLLRHGHGALKPRGWKRTARAVFDLRDPLHVTFDDSPEARAIKRDFEAARLLVKLAKQRPAP